MIPAFLCEFVRTIIIMSITGGLLCLLLLALKPIIRHRLPKLAQYCFWIVILGAFLVPVSYFVVLPSGAPNIVPIHNIVESNVISQTEHVNMHTAPPSLAAPANHPPAELPPAERSTLDIPRPSLVTTASTIFMIAYPIISLLLITYSIIGYLRFVMKVRRSHVKPKQSQQNMLVMLTKGKRTPKLFFSTYAATPMLIGVFNPTIVLPNREFSEEQLHSILLHELTHMRRFDVFVKWLSLAVCSLHWFNPLAWIARREIDRICELACDEAVIRDMDANNKQNYGETLIAVASDKKIPLPVLSTTMCAEKRAIKERLGAIMTSKKHTKLAVIISTLVLLAVVLAACALGAARNASDNESADDNPQTIQDFAFQYINDLVQELTVGVFPHGVDDDYFYVRPANIIEININTLEKEAEFDNVLPHTIELWRLDFMILTDDLEDGYLRWGTFSPDEDGWVGHRTAWNDSRTLLVFTVDGESIELLGSIPWWMEETPYGLEGALHTFMGQSSLQSDLRTPTPPLNIREWNEVDNAFLDSFGGRQGLTFVEHGDLSNPIPFVERWWWHSQLENHTMIFWADEELFDFRVVALGFNDTNDSMSFYVRYELDNIGWFAPDSLYFLNASLLHYLIPRMGITFTDSHGNHHRMLIQESMRGEPYPLFNLAVHDESHFAAWDESVPPEPFVMREMGVSGYVIRGIGGHRVSYDPRQGSFDFAGSGFDVMGLYGEAIEGVAQITQDSIRVIFAVARNEIILPNIDGPLGTLAGPTVAFEYIRGVGIVGDIEIYPFEFYDDRHMPS